MKIAAPSALPLFPLRALLLDLDNTLYCEAFAGILAKVNARIEMYMVDRLGMTPAQATAVRVETWGGRHGNTLAGLMERYDVQPDHYLDYIHQIEDSALPARDARLDAMLGAIALPKYLFTNGHRGWAERVLAALGIRHRFVRLFTIEDVGYKAKPHPDGYRIVADAMGMAPNEILFLDDVPANLAPARALGMRTALVHREGDHPVDMRLSSIHDLATHLAALDVMTRA